MLENGDVVDAEVTNVQVFGIFCQHRGQDLLVKIPEISWVASFNSSLQFASPGDRHTVKIIHVDKNTAKIAATIKGRFPDPWRTDQLKVGATHTAIVVRYVDKSDRCGNNPAYMLELVPGAFVMLEANRLSLSVGETIVVTISESQPESRAIRVTPT